MKTFIKNRHGLNICVVVDEVEHAKDFAIIMHGLYGFKEQKHIQVIKDAFLESGISTLTFDATHALGESDGDVAECTVTSYFEDVEDVCVWAKTQDFCQLPFILTGHSLGSFSILHYAEKFPEDVKALAPTATVISGEYWYRKRTPEYLMNWKSVGCIESESSSKPGVMKRLNYSFVTDVRKHSILNDVEKLTMPVLLLAGDQDTSTPISEQQELFNLLPGKKELHVIKGAEHTYRKQEHLDELRSIFLQWIEKTL